MSLDFLFVTAGIKSKKKGDFSARVRIYNVTPNQKQIHRYVNRKLHGLKKPESTTTVGDDGS